VTGAEFGGGRVQLAQANVWAANQYAARRPWFVSDHSKAEMYSCIQALPSPSAFSGETPKAQNGMFTKSSTEIAVSGLNNLLHLFAS
jgi:hypothetical protein